MQFCSVFSDSTRVVSTSCEGHLMQRNVQSFLPMKSQTPMRKFRGLGSDHSELADATRSSESHSQPVHATLLRHKIRCGGPSGRHRYMRHANTTFIPQRLHQHRPISIPSDRCLRLVPASCNRAEFLSGLEPPRCLRGDVLQRLLLAI